MISLESATRVVRVLIVDEALEDRDGFRRLLLTAPGTRYEIAEAGSAEEATTIAATFRPDCVLLDYDLPDGNGLTLSGALVAAHGMHAFGIVMLADLAATAVTVDALPGGVHDFLIKESVQAGLLQQTVINAMEKAALHRELEAGRVELARKNEEFEKHVIQLEREVAERKNAELALKDSQSFLQSVVGATTDCLKVLDLDGRVLWMSPNGQRLMEITDFAPYQNADWASFWAYDGKEAQARAVIAAAREGKVARLQGCFPTITGKLKWWDVLASPINGRDGRPEKILSVSRDVSEIRSTDEALREREAQLRLATATGKVGVWDWDIVADRVTWSESLYAVHGIEPGKFGGTVAAFAVLLHPDDADRVKAAIDDALAGRAIPDDR